MKKDDLIAFLRTELRWASAVLADLGYDRNAARAKAAAEMPCGG